MKKKPRVLMVEDSQSLAAMYAAYFARENVELHIVDSLAVARNEWIRIKPDIVLLDVEMADGHGLDLIRNMPETERSPVILVMTPFGFTESAVDAIGLGAFDYLSKPFDADRLHVTLENALNRRLLQSQKNDVAELTHHRSCGFVGDSLPMQSVYKTLNAVAAGDATAFVVGESGTGKELAALAIHQKSNRRNKLFLAFDCDAIPSEIMESELFGHIRGAFLGAVCSKQGMASAADGGTLFLDEICEMDLGLQKKLLRFVQTGEFQKIGSDVVERADVRFICATRKIPFEEVQSGRFREILYERLYRVPIAIPPLRERGADILAIAVHLLNSYARKEQKDFTKFSEDAKKQILTYKWPGNVRELQNVIKRAIELNQGVVLRLGELSLKNGFLNVLTRHTNNLTEPAYQNGPVSSKKTIEPLWMVEMKTIQNAIQECEGNVAKAASLLELSPSTVHQKLRSSESKILMIGIGC
jgi:two-component system repressor protein LuxO